ncbi:MAG: discoidin domain-containing protein, partial [Planctomycetes bacterium]|nr:discoidin domain-containing protein [Planctomycetota bacterium]
MSKKLIFLTSFVLVLALAGNALATLAAHWKFDNNATDSVGTLNWTLNGGAAYSTDAKEGSHSLMLDGTGDYASQTAVGTLVEEFSTETVMMWFKANTTNGTQVLYDEGGITRGLSIRINNGNLETAVRDASTQVTASTSFSSTDWTHVAATFDNGLFTLYVNGKQVDSITAGFTAVTAHSNGAGIGARNGQDAFGNSGTGDYFGGLIDDVQVYDNVLTVDEIRRFGGVQFSKADEPSPADGQTDVVREVVLNWKPGEFADTHDVYFGTSFADVNSATNLDPMGPDNIYKARQGDNSYAIPERLDFGQTYYWRIDEVNAPPTSHVVFKGDVWSFTAEPVGYPISGQNIIATASSTHQADAGPENTINGLGLDANDLHSIEPADMWLSSSGEPNGAWIEYELDKVHKLHEMWVWNHNGMMEPILGLGLKDVTIEYSTNGTDYTTLGTTHEFARAPGAVDYAHNTTVDFSGVTAKYVRLTTNSNWGNILDQYGLSEVRFLHIPVFAREPSPDSGTTNVAVDVTLGFRAGREAAEHNMYLSTDEQAVIDGNAPVTTVTEASYGPLSLDLGTTYYWKINEVNEAETPTTWQGEIWNFTTPDFFVVDGFEDYNDYPPDEIWSTWVDGYGVQTNGATTGYP